MAKASFFSRLKWEAQAVGNKAQGLEVLLPSCGRDRDASAAAPDQQFRIIIQNMTGSHVSESESVLDNSGVGRWRHGLLVALASLWIIDGLLQFQPAMYSRSLDGFLAKVLQYNTMGRPNPLTDLIRFLVTLTYGTHSHQIIFNTVAALAQIAVGVAILFRKTERVGLLASAFWALVPWVVGEAMGQMLFPQASMAFTGTPGAALIYLFLSIVLLRDHSLYPGSDSDASQFRREPGRAEEPSRLRVGSVSDLGVAGSRTALAAWAVVWVGSALFELELSNWSPNAISAQLKGIAAGEPSWISGMDHLLSHLTTGRGTTIALLMAVVQAWVGVAALRPKLRRAALGVGIALSLFYWVAGQNFGQLLTGNATDPNLGPVMVLFALALWPISAKEPSTPDGADLEAVQLTDV
jgi:hypothetical protein